MDLTKREQALEDLRRAAAQAIAREQAREARHQQTERKRRARTLILLGSAITAEWRKSPPTQAQVDRMLGHLSPVDRQYVLRYLAAHASA